MSIQGIVLLYFFFIALPFVAAIAIFWIFANKKIKADRAAGILPPKKKKKPSIFRRLFNYYIDKQASVRK